MKLVSHGVSRQDAHEQIRVLSREAVQTVKMEGGKNDLIERIKKTEFFVSNPPSSVSTTQNIHRFRVMTGANANK